MNIVITKLSENKMIEMGVRSWPIWSCEVSEFEWEYCLLLEGEVEVSGDFKSVKFGVGDYVVFPKGLKCRWKVIRPVRKHYSFG